MNAIRVIAVPITISAKTLYCSCRSTPVQYHRTHVLDRMTLMESRRDPFVRVTSVQMADRPCATRLGLALFALLLALIFPATAIAQAYPCPQGPGPGERQIGTSGGSHGVAAMPMCVDDGAPDDGQAAYPAGPAPIHTAHWVFAIGTTADGHSAYVLAADPVFAGDAEALLFRRCNAAGVRDCRIVRRFGSGVFAVAQAADGGYVHAIYPYPELTSEMRHGKKARKQAEQAIIEACVQQTGGPCKLKEIRPSNEWSGYDR
jgi:hypothetical protein